MQTTVTARGRTVIPARIRRDHEIEPRTKLEWIDDGHTIRVMPVPEDPVSSVKGTTRGLGRRLFRERRR